MCARLLSSYVGNLKASLFTVHTLTLKEMEDYANNAHDEYAEYRKIHGLLTLIKNGLLHPVDPGRLDTSILTSEPAPSEYKNTVERPRQTHGDEVTPCKITNT